MVTRKRKVFLLFINGLALLLALLIYFNKTSEFDEIESGFGKIESGFKAIDQAYLEPLQDIHLLTDSIISRAVLKDVKNDTLAILLINQNSLGSYYLDYQDAIQNELIEIAKGISVQKSIQRTLLILIVIIVLFNTISLLISYGESH